MGAGRGKLRARNDAVLRAGLSGRLPGSGEALRGLTYAQADRVQGLGRGVVAHRAQDERTNDVTRDRDRDSHGASAAHDPPQGRQAIGVTAVANDLVERGRLDDASLTARAGDRVVAVGELDGEAAGRNPERVVELARLGGAADQVAAEQ